MRRRVGALLALAPLIACESEEPPVDAGSGMDENPVVSLSSLCQALAEADCARLERCGYLTDAFDRSACLERQREVACAPLARALARAEESGEITWLDSAGRRCVEAARNGGCDLGTTYDLFARSECRSAFTPRARPGDPCSFAGSCVLGSVCDLEPCPGACRALSSVNESCDDIVRRCEPGLFCGPLSRRCEAQSDLGAACEARDPRLPSSCRLGTFCDGSQTPAVCVASRGRASGCDGPAQCAPGLQCIASLCSGGLLGDRCRGDLDCRGNTRCVGTRCVALAAEGEACGSEAPCGLGLGCSNEICVRGAADGEACGPDRAPCRSGRCVDGACAPRAPDGDACLSAGDCLDGRGCEGGVCRAIGPFCPL